MMIATFNVLWTTFPSIVLGIWEEDCPETEVLADPRGGSRGGLEGLLRGSRRRTAPRLKSWPIQGI
eukprot:730474-Prorocentrum_minimum.AAC.1